MESATTKRAYYQRNREKWFTPEAIAKRIEYARRNRQAAYARQRKWRNRNTATERARNKAWRESNRPYFAAYMREWQAKHKQDLPRCTPAWADRDAILAIYERAKVIERETGIKQHVDHIVPLRHDLVCGLHCEANLRVIPAAENFAKGNRHWPGMP